MNRKLGGFLLWIPSLAAGTLLAVGGARAEDSAAPPTLTPVRLGLAEVIERARRASPRLRQLRALQEGAESQVRGARAERLPQLDLSAQASRLSHVPEFVAPFPPPQGPTAIFPDLPNRYAARLGLTLPLFTGGRIAGRLLAAEKERNASQKDLESGAGDLVLEATASYWDLLTSQESERVFREAVASYDAHLQDALARQRQGLAARNEVLAVQVERDEAELARIRAASDAEVAQADLLRLLGLGSDSEIEPTEALEPLKVPREDLEQLVAEALARRNDRAALKARVEAAEARVRVERAERFPQARLSAGYEVLNPNLRFFPPEEGWQDDWDATLSLSLHVFDGGRTAAAVAAGEADREATHQQLEELDRQIRFEVNRRTLDLKNSIEEVELADKNLEAAKENRRVASERFRAGVIPSSELLDAETALLRAGLQRTTSLSGQRLALARLDRALGR